MNETPTFGINEVWWGTYSPPGSADTSHLYTPHFGGSVELGDGRLALVAICWEPQCSQWQVYRWQDNTNERNPVDLPDEDAEEMWDKHFHGLWFRDEHIETIAQALVKGGENWGVKCLETDGLDECPLVNMEETEA